MQYQKAPLYYLCEAAQQIKEAADDTIIHGVCDAILAMPRHHNTAVFLYSANLSNTERTQAYLAQEAIEDLAEELAAGHGNTFISAVDNWLARQSHIVQVMFLAGLGLFFVMVFAFFLNLAK